MRDTCFQIIGNPDVSIGGEALNRVTNMVDALGTTAYSHAAGGQLETEDGSFANVPVTHTYNNRLRTGLSLKQPASVILNRGVE